MTASPIGVSCAASAGARARLRADDRIRLSEQLGSLPRGSFSWVVAADRISVAIEIRYDFNVTIL